jgi:hypothetical protein
MAVGLWYRMISSNGICPFEKKLPWPIRSGNDKDISTTHRATNLETGKFRNNVVLTACL